MNRALRICRSVGCPALVASGYCDKHKKNEVFDVKKRFEKMESKKTPEQRKFYSSKLWTETSKRHRELNPLCVRCKKNGTVVPATLVHHEPSREKLISMGLSPFDHKFLESLCFPCHQKELRNHAGK